MAEKHCCPQCGSPMAPDAPQGLCPGCLLRQGLESQYSESMDGSRPSEAFPPPTPSELAPLFPDLEILELIGRGGMGMVYKARQKRLDRIVALKILSPTVGQDLAFADRFAREAQALAMLNHQHIVAVYDFGQTRGEGREERGENTNEGNTPSSPLYFFLMEYVDGLNLRRLLADGQLTPEEALAIVPQICEALQYAHDAGIVHRDIKPENLLLDKQGRVKIADFGIAKLVGGKVVSGQWPVASEQQRSSLPQGEGQGEGAPSNPSPLTAAGQVIGTPHYMAPEQAANPQQVDHRADIYSLGVVFYQMLTGELPTGRFAPPSKKVQIDVRLDEVVLRALEKEPERRYQQASELKTHVETIGATRCVTGAASASDATIEEARRQVKGPAIALLIAGMLNCFFVPMFAMIATCDLTFVEPNTKSVTSGVEIFWMIATIIAFVFATLFPGVLMIVAAVKMKRLQAYWLAVVAGIFAVILSPIGFFIGLPIGIWSLVVLSQGNVRIAFRYYPKQSRPILKLVVITAAVVAIAIGTCIFVVKAVYLWQQSKIPKHARMASIEQRYRKQLDKLAECAFDYEHFKSIPRRDGDEFSQLFADLAILNAVVYNNNALNKSGIGVKSDKHSLPLGSSSWCCRSPSIDNPVLNLWTSGDQQFVEYCACLLDRKGVERSYTILFDPSKIPHGPWIAQLPGGGTVELAGVGDKNHWWQPDGSPLPEPPYDSSHGSGVHSKKYINRYFFARVSNLPSRPAGMTCNVPEACGTGIPTGVTQHGKDVPNFGNFFAFSAAVPATQRATTVRCGMSSGPWKDVAANTFSEGSITGRGWSVINGESNKGDLSQPIETKAGFSVVAFDFLTGEIRVIAVQNDGQVTEGKLDLDFGRSSGNGTKKKAQRMTTATFAGLTLKQIKQIKLQYRPYQWVEFRNVALHPNHPMTAPPTKSKKQDKPDASQLTQQGWQLWQAGQPGKAVEKFREAVKLDPKSENAWNGLGWASFNSGNQPEAEKAFKKVIALAPNHPAALNGLGQLYLAQQKYDLAETYLLKAAPQATAAWWGLAKLYLLQGKYDKAEKWAQKIVDSGEANDDARRLLEAAKKKHLDDALRSLISPQGTPAHNNSK